MLSILHSCGQKRSDNGVGRRKIVGFCMLGVESVMLLLHSKWPFSQLPAHRCWWHCCVSLMAWHQPLNSSSPKPQLPCLPNVICNCPVPLSIAEPRVLVAGKKKYHQCCYTFLSRQHSRLLSLKGNISQDKSLFLLQHQH